MSFDDAEAYGRFMGRNSGPLADSLLRVIDTSPGQRALDVGCGSGVLTSRLVDRLGTAAVSAVDPSESFVTAAQLGLPGVEILRAGAEHLPFPDATFDLTLAQLVANFMTDPVAGITEMARVTKPQGIIAASVWDFGGERSPLSPFWRAVRLVDPEAHDETGMPGTTEGSLLDLFRRARLSDVVQSELEITVPFSGFDEWWEPFTLGVGPAGDYVARLDAGGREVIRSACAGLLPNGQFEITSVAWLAVGRPAEAAHPA